MDNLDWNDLRYVLAVARSGSAASAARLLGISHATVIRRIQAIERGVGVPLFNRLAQGYTPTEVGRLFTDISAALERTIGETRRELEGQATALAGTIRFTTTDSLAEEVVPPILASFRALHPEIRVQLLITNARLDLDKREADVALRPVNDPPENWIGKRLAHVDWGVFAARTYLAERRDTPWEMLDWLMPSGALMQGPVAAWAHAQVAPAQRVASADSYIGLRNLALAGMGATVLPRFLVLNEPRLELLHSPPGPLSFDLWVLTHPELRQTARIQVFMQHVAQHVRALRPRLLAQPRSAPAAVSIE